MTRHTESVEVVVTGQRRRRWSVAKKAALVRRAYELGMSVSLVAREEGVSPGLIRLPSKTAARPQLVVVLAQNRNL